MKPLSILLLLLTSTAFAQAPKQEATPSQTPGLNQQSFETMHSFYVSSFVSTPGFGMSRMRRVSAISDRMWWIGGDFYIVKNIQLISLLKHDPPVVYPAMTDMTQLQHKEGTPAPDKKDATDTRPLNEFETAALKQLMGKKDDQVVRDGTKLVGAIRAQTSCTKCHDDQVGDLIGAFTYELEKQAPPAK